ncbi:MAG: hypothetical protein JO153_02565 [Solirubrobacterales bacterium]|nr:hypothetical protein [Solirubrobacterales bacterium]
MQARIRPGLVAALAAGALGLLGSAGAASAHDLVVRGANGTRVIITRAPFGLSFRDSRGRVVLRSTPATARSLRLRRITQRQYGVQDPPPPTLYAPLTFVVGRQTIMQTPSGQWGGTLASVTTAGIEYRAGGVIKVSSHGDAVRLTLATTDPSGRRLVVRIAPGLGRGFTVSARPVPARGVAAIAVSFRDGREEAFRGFGGRHNGLDQRGSEFFNWINQENFSSGSRTGLARPSLDSRYLFPNGSQAAYYVQSSFTSSAGYGFLLDRDELSHWRLASDRRDAWQVQANGSELDYAVIPGPDSPVEALNALTGRQPLPPRWALGTLFDREVRFPSDPPAQYEREIESDIRNFDRYRIHVDGYRIEGWQFLSRAVLRRIFAQLRRRGIHPMVYFRAFVGTDDIGTDDPSLYAYALRHRYVATHADGSPYTFVSNFGRPAAVIDFTNPAAARWWRGRITQALALGADGFMQDFGEQVQADMHFHDGSTGLSMHNRYPVLYHHETRRAVDAFRQAHPERQIFFFTRAGYSGTPGSTAYENANFPGDETTDWTRAAGIASLAPDMLNRSVGGAYGFSTDIGGYYDIGPYPPTSKELFLRWVAWSALSPFYRLHGSVLAGVHAPWSFDASTVRIYKSLARLHARLVPLLVRLWEQADRTGVPVIRPLWLAAPGDPRAAAQDQEWMVGSDLLAAPVVRQSARTRTAYLPVGCWRLRGAGARISGGRSVTVPAPLEQAVYFTRCGRDPLAAPSAPRSLTATAAARPRWLVSARILVPGNPANLDCRRAVCRHNENTDLTRWRGAIYLVHRTAGSQVLGPNSSLRVYRSTDAGRRFRLIAIIPAARGRDIRDPCFYTVGRRLFIKAITRLAGFALRDRGAGSITVQVHSSDGRRWSVPRAIGPLGWGFWRVIAHAGALYAGAYEDGDVQTRLFTSRDGARWKRGGEIYGTARDTPLEPELVFSPSGRQLLALVRLDGSDFDLLGYQGRLRTRVCWARAPFTRFSCPQTLNGVRLDGAVAFFWHRRLFVIARKHLPGSGIRKRTALYELGGNLEGGPLRARELGELPSAGDTSYAGVVSISTSRFLVTWYSSPLTGDPSWLTGFGGRTDIWQATIDLARL